MSRRAYSDPGHAHFLTFSCFHRRQFLTDNRVRQWLAESIHAARIVHDLSVWAYVFMPEHVHLLILPNQVYSISKILRDIKEPVSQSWVIHLRASAPWRLKAMEARQGHRTVHRLWQAGGGYDRNLFNWDAVAKAIEYIEWNPVERGLAKEPMDWVWSSARARAGLARVPLRMDSVDVAGSRSST